jgi:two-component system, NarL family, nitrate/nitrite response regulator NarL
MMQQRLLAPAAGLFDDTLRVGVLEDEPLMRDMLADVLGEAHLSVPVCEAEVEPFLRAVDSASSHERIDVAIIDLRIERPGVGALETGLRAVRELHARHPEVRQLVLSALDTPQMTEQALAAGAHAFLSKLRVGRAQVVEAVRALAADEQLSPSRFEAPAPVQVPGVLSRLTPRELEVLRHVAVGMDNLKVAAHLGITERTVKAHVCSLYAKLGVENRAEMALRGHELGLRPEREQP